jgi:outer membrane protein OmpA-like peptidoglycan-associated protein
MTTRSREFFISMALAAAVAGAAWGESTAPNTTDLSSAPVDAIEVGDITEALAVPRGTSIEPSAPPKVLLPIYFEFNSATLRPEADELLEKVGAALASSELEPFSFAIEGHTDDVGSAGYNERLSKLRANAVEVKLREHGIPTRRLKTAGHGESAPVATNGTDEGRTRNRRVEIINLGSGDQ